MNRNPFWILTCICLLLTISLLLTSCQQSNPPPLSPEATPQRTVSAAPSHTPVPSSAATQTPDPNSRLASAEAYMAVLTATAEIEQTYIYQTNAASDRTAVAGFNQTATAILHEIQVTVTPRTYQSIPSPNGKYLAQVILYDCAQIQPGPESPNSYEVLKISPWTVETQLIYCGEIGTAGLGGKFWSPDSRFFYYTNAREGWPDGGYPWERPISRFDVTTGKSETLAVAMFSPDRKKIAGAQGADLVIWEIDSGAVTRFSGPGDQQDWINWLAWSPDGKSLAYLTQSNCQDTYPCPSTLTRADLDPQAQTQLLGKDDPAMLMVRWNQPNSLQLFGSDFQTWWIYDLKTGNLIKAPVTTPTPFVQPTATPAPTYPPNPAFPPDIYPPAMPIRQMTKQKGVEITVHGCPDLTNVQAAAEPSAETLLPVLEAVRSGDVHKIRANSDVSFWPATGLSLRLQDSSLDLGDISVQPAAESPLADEFTSAWCADLPRISWWAQVNADDGVTDYFVLQRKGRWLVWVSAYKYE